MRTLKKLIQKIKFRFKNKKKEGNLRKNSHKKILRINKKSKNPMTNNLVLNKKESLQLEKINKRLKQFIMKLIKQVVLRKKNINLKSLILKMNSNQDFMDFYRSQFSMNKQMINRKMSKFFKITRFSQMNVQITK